MREYIVFGREHYNHLGVIRSLGENGIKPIAIIVKSKMKLASKSKFIKKLHMVESIEEGYKFLVQEYADKFDEKPFVFTADDKMTRILDKNFNELNQHFIFYNAGADGRILQYMNKKQLGCLAEKYGLKVLNSEVVENGVLPTTVQYPVITKAIDSTAGAGKADMFICNNPDELKNAFKKIKSKKVIVQHYINKKNEYCLEGFSINHGKSMIITIASTYLYKLPMTYSPYMKVTNFDRNDIKPALDAMFREIGFEGIFEIEFLVDEKNELYFGEINFRNSTWSYASTRAGMPLPVLWSRLYYEETIPESVIKKVPNNFTAMVETNDFKERVLGKKVSFFTWLHDLKRANCKYYIGKGDIIPFLSSLISRI